MSLLKPFVRVNRLVAGRFAIRCRPATVGRAPFLLQLSSSSQRIGASALRLSGSGQRSFASAPDTASSKLAPTHSPSLWTDAARGLIAPASTVAATRMLHNYNPSNFTIPRSLLHTSSSASSRARTGIMTQRQTALPYFSLARRGMASDAGGGQSRAWVNPQAVPIGDSLKKYAIDLTQLARGRGSLSPTNHFTSPELRSVLRHFTLCSDGKLDPVIGREEEMRRTIEILSRRTKVSGCPVLSPLKRHAVNRVCLCVFDRLA
jgi:ATP-dependent Clp protease ATP-binding subunit ClpA